MSRLVLRSQTRKLQMRTLPTIFSLVPVAANFGWGICGRNLLRALSQFGDVKLVYGDYRCERSSNAIEDSWIRSCLASEADKAVFESSHSHVSLMPISEYGNLPESKGGGSRRVGLSFNLMLPPGISGELRDTLQFVAAGSEWCRQLFLDNDIPAVAAPQGVDAAIFHEGFSDKTLPDDRFYIYSGGKFEFRKGQDYVIKALRHMQQKFADVVLVVQWTNPWEYSFNTMQYSSLIDFERAEGMTADNSEYFIKRTLIQNGIDLNRVIIAAGTPQAQAPLLIRETDIGVFPNRIEGGTNLVLMEYMACGKPAIATYHTGHVDVVSDDWSLPLKNNTERRLQEHYPPGYNSWYEADIEELISHLEWAYLHREQARALGKKAAARMRAFTWDSMASRIMQAL